MLDLSESIERKFIDSIDLDSEWEIETDIGWSPISAIHKTIEYEEWEIETETGLELICADTHILFDDKFNQIFTKDIIPNKTYIKTINGNELVTKINNTHNKSNMYDLTINSEQQRFYTNNILSHNTSTTIAYLLWLVLFIDQQNLLITANKRQVAEDILEKLKIAYENIPLWLQQGILEWNKGDIELENGSKIRATSTTSGAARSGTYDAILLDEFAHIQPKMANDFYASVYPVISSGTKSKIIMISTPKGMNLFHKFWIEACKKQNRFVPFEIHWREVPGRDDKWYQDTLANIGEEKFQIEFECQFLGSSNTLISSLKLQQMTYENPILTKGTPDNKIDVYYEPIKESIDEDTGEIISTDHKYVIVVDPAEGKHLDYSAFSVIDVTKTPYIQVAKYHSNTIHPILFPSIIYEAGRYYNDAMVLVEIQSVGLQITEILHNELEYEGIYRVSSGNKKSQQISAGHIRNSAPGVKTTGAVKKIGCSNLKTLIETDQLIIKDFDTYQELTTFVFNTKGTYSADTDEDNDDLAITLVLFAWLTTQKYFKETLTHSLRKGLQKTILDYEDRDLLPPPMVDDGMIPNLEKWDNTLWTEMNAESSYIDPYGKFWKTYSPERRSGEGLTYDQIL